MAKKVSAVIIAILLITSPSLSFAQSQMGRVSYYHEGRHTASGERFNKNSLTCAHKRLPFGTYVVVTFRNRSATCRVNDRGPFVRGRVLDVSLGTARALGMIGSGVVMASLRW